MNLLFEISDKLLIIITIVIVLFVVIGILIYKLTHRKALPISEDDRFDSDELSVKKIDSSSDIELTDEQKEAKEELELVFNRMSADLEKQNALDEVEEFEKEQEENAIISYQELIKQAEALKEEARKYEETLEAKASLRVKEVKLDNKDEKIEYAPKKTFKSSDIVSPIYGIQSNKNMVRRKKHTNRQNGGIIDDAYEGNSELEKTKNLEFLNSLKEFRNNL